jgi:hypothetical protein
LPLADEVTQIVLDIGQKRSEVVRIVPAPARQILEVIFINKLQSIDVVGQNVPKFFGLGVGIDLEVSPIVVSFPRSIHILIHLLQSKQGLFLMFDFCQKHLLKFIFKILLLMGG